MTVDRDELATLCEGLPELRDLAVHYGLSEQLDSLVAAARTGTDLGTRRIDLLRRMGIPAGPTRYPRLPGLSGGRPSAELYACPAGRCSRRWVRPPGDPVPTCAVQDAPLRAETTRR
jgi:hypothetical protein